mgnify:CR=1 FL=1
MARPPWLGRAARKRHRHAIILISTQVVNQKNVLWDHLSCRDHLSLFARLRGVDIEGDARHAAEQALAVVGLSDHADKAAGRLSGGMKRKLAVAVALVGGPSVVLLDEPSSGLDPGAQRNLWDLIKVTMKGRAVVLTTHSMGEADLLCDRVGIMVKGTMRCIGTPQELKERYAAGYEISCRLETRDDAHVADLVAFAREAFSSPDGDVAAADADIATLELAGVDPRRTPALAFRAFDDDACARLGVTDFSLARATMEKVFLRIAGGEEGLAQSRLGREIAEMLQAEAADDAQKGRMFFAVCYYRRNPGDLSYGAPIEGSRAVGSMTANKLAAVTAGKESPDYLLRKRPRLSATDCTFSMMVFRAPLLATQYPAVPRPSE